MLDMDVSAPSVNGEALASLMQALDANPDLKNRLLHSLLGENACRQLGLTAYPPGFKLSVVIPVYNEEQIGRAHV